MTRINSDPIADSSCGLGSGKKKALLIVVEDNRVEGLPRLPHAQRDVENLQRLLIEVYEFPAKDIVLMMDRKSIPRELWPTKTRIIAQIQLFVQGVSAGDHLFFYYSGHGRQVPCHHHTEPDGLDEGIYTCTGKDIMDNELKKWLVDPLPQGCKLFALWDSCHSHTILDLDHYICNEPRSERRMRLCRESGSQSTSWRVRARRLRRIVVTPTSKSVPTTAPRKFRGRPVVRAPVSITAVSDGGSPPLSKWIPFSVESIQRVLSPSSWFRCNGRCPLQSESDAKRAHVISLSACKDNESAYDDVCSGTMTSFFVDHLRVNPKSTLLELLQGIRQRVDKTTAARKECARGTRAISRRRTSASSRILGSGIEADWTPRVKRRETEVNVGTLDELFTWSRTRQEDEAEFSQKPSYSSHYRLNLNELIDL